MTRPRAHAEAMAYAAELAALGAARVVAVNASAYFSRPGPRLIDGLELLAHILHPSAAPAPPQGAEALELRTATRRAERPARAVASSGFGPTSVG